MSISLSKGQKVSLSKEGGGGLGKVLLGLGWDEVAQKRGFFASKPQPIDCDASVLLLQSGKLADVSDLVYYGNLKHKSGALVHMGDNLTGAGEGDDEQITIDLSCVPAQYDRLVVVVTIYQANQRGQHFGLIANAFVRLVDCKTNQEILKYNLSNDYQNMTALIFGEVYRHNGEWKFSAVGQGTTDPGLGELANRFK